jgi:hypothetical protein
MVLVPSGDVDSVGEVIWMTEGDGTWKLWVLRIGSETGLRFRLKWRRYANRSAE